MSNGSATKQALQKPIQRVQISSPHTIHGRERVFVHPATVHLGGSEPVRTIVWENKTGGTVKIWLASAQKILKSSASDDLSRPVIIPSPGQLVVSVQEGLKDCWHDYHVYCEKIGNYAEGNSSPHLSSP